MPTFKVVVLPHQKRSDGTYNVKVRVTQDRVSRFIRTSHYVSLSDISKRKDNGKERIKIKNQAIKDLMDELILSYKKKLMEAGPKIEEWDVDRIVEFITSKKSKDFSLDFIAYARNYINLMKEQGRIGTAKRHQTAINALERFAGKSLDINCINLSFLRKFETFILFEPKQGYNKRDGKVEMGGEKGKASVVAYMSSLRLIHKMAKDEYNDEENGVINIPLSPFAKYVMPKNNVPKPRTLTIEQIQKIIDLPYNGRSNSLYNLAKDVFLLSFGLMGMNTADMFEANRMDGNVLIYERKKTRSRRNDRAEMKVRVEPEIISIMERYKGSISLFSFRERLSDSKNFNSLVNRELKKIGVEIGIPELNFYYARHSMASICANKLGIDIARVDEMLNHSDPKLALARVYIEKDFKPLWEANRKLIDLFDWGFYTGNIREKPED